MMLGPKAQALSYLVLTKYLFLPYSQTHSSEIPLYYTKHWFYVQIKHLIEDHCSDQAQKAETVLSATSLIFVISIDLFYLSMFHWVIIYWSLSIV